jgi:DNA-directed RNA polymerase subunit alpha
MPTEEAQVEDSQNDKSMESALNLSIDDLELSARSSNCLKRAGIEIVSELVEKDMQALIQIKNFGKKSADEINDKLRQYNLELKIK